MNKNKKKTLLVILILIFFISIGFSYLSSNLKINGGTGISPMKWSVYFDNIVEDNDNTVAAIKPATIESNKTKLSFDVNLEKPLDKYGFQFDIRNDGTIDAMIESIELYGFSVEQSKYIDYKVNYLNGDELKLYDLLKAGSSKKLHLSVLYKDSNSDLLSDFNNVTLTLNIVYVQADNRANDRG